LKAGVAIGAFDVHIRPVESETGKLPKAQSYPLRPSALEAALARAGVEIDTHLIRGPGVPSDAHFLPPNDYVAYERLSIRVGSVPSREAAAARLRFETVALPALVAWIGAILALDIGSPIRREQQYLDLRNP
jgi:hypothetical protein